MRWIFAGGAILTVGAAFAVGVWVGTAQAKQAAPADAEAAGDRIPVARMARLRGLVCLRPPGDEEEERGDDMLRPALQWCESRLERCESRGAFRRHAWPEDAAVESPEQWTEAVQSAIEQCELGIEMELVDCTEYPCVAAWRPPKAAGPGNASSDAASDAYREELKKKLVGCAPLRAAFGVGEDAKEWASVWAYDAPCEAGNEPMVALSVLQPQGPAYATLNDDDVDHTEETLRWMFRRAEDVASSWRCGRE